MELDLNLTSDDHVSLKSFKENNAVIQYLANKERLKFNIGDILIRKTANWDYETEKTSWVVESISSTNPLPRRYVFVHQDEYGVGYIKRLKVSNGELGDELLCLADIDFDEERFEVDPLYLDSVLMGDGTFDIKSLQKIELQRKQEIVDFNQRSALVPKKLSEINAFLLSMKPGDSFYEDNYGNYLGIDITKLTIVSIKEKFISRLSEDAKYSAEELINDKNITDVKKVVEVKCINEYNDEETINSFDFLSINHGQNIDHLYRNKPRSLFGEE